jgi:HSP20 family protein
VKEGDWHLHSFSYGKFEQTVSLPRGTDVDAVSAAFKNGVLEVTIPLPKATLPKKIEVKELAEASR